MPKNDPAGYLPNVKKARRAAHTMTMPANRSQYKGSLSKDKIIASGPATDDKKAMSKLPPAPDAEWPPPRMGSAVLTNTTGNKRSGMQYVPRITKKGVLHDYPGTKFDTLVKPKKSKNAPTRSYKGRGA